MRICSIAMMRLCSLASRLDARYACADAVPCPRQQASEASRGHLVRTRSGEHYDIEPGKTFNVVTEALANLALQPMARHGATYHATGNSEPESGMMYVVGPHDERYDVHVQPDSTGKDPWRSLSAAAAATPVRIVDRRACAQAASLCRPFARRALRILRPALVAIRARKP